MPVPSAAPPSADETVISTTPPLSEVKVTVPEVCIPKVRVDWALAVLDAKRKASIVVTNNNLRIVDLLSSSNLRDPRARKTFGSVLVGLVRSFSK
jgi:hypothetical protein